MTDSEAFSLRRCVLAAVLSYDKVIAFYVNNEPVSQVACMEKMGYVNSSSHTFAELQSTFM